MALWERWYMHDRGSGRQTPAWRRHRPPERVVDLDPFALPPRKSSVPRKRGGRLRQWLLAGTLMGIGASMVLAAFALLWSGQTVAVDPAGMVSEVAIWLKGVKDQALGKAASWLEDLRSHERIAQSRLGLDRALGETADWLEELRFYEQTGQSNLRFGKPSSAIVKVELMTSFMVYECNGAVISRDKVLTAAHCLTDDRGRRLPGRLSVIPISDLGWRTEPWEVTAAVTRGFNHETLRNDIAVLTVRRGVRGESIGDVTGWFGRSSSRLSPIVLGRIGSVGVHRREVCSRVWYVGGKIKHDCFSEPGASGSPIFHVDAAEGEAYIVGILSAGEDVVARGDPPRAWSVSTRLIGEMWNLVEREVQRDLY